MTTSEHAPPTGLPDRARARGERQERVLRLSRGAIDGRREDLDELVAELTPLLWRVARSFGLDSAGAEDVVQTTWLILLTHLDQIRGPESLVGWLVTVTRRECLRVVDAGRRERPMDVETLEQAPVDNQSLDEGLLTSERQKVLWRVIRQLPERCVQLLQVVAFGDRPNYAAIATALEMPIGSIGPTRGRCLEKLRALLSAQPDWSRP